MRPAPIAFASTNATAAPSRGASSPTASDAFAAAPSFAFTNGVGLPTDTIVPAPTAVDTTNAVFPSPKHERSPGPTSNRAAAERSTSRGLRRSSRPPSRPTMSHVPRATDDPALPAMGAASGEVSSRTTSVFPPLTHERRSARPSLSRRSSARTATLVRGRGDAPSSCTVAR